ncbi:hypothetical protein [Streptomyces sp. NBC_00199]|nr:hypothetical protein [Streptomyces sp. NBC_00199]MCX5264698.1 hypothetical protein [Streptomyces sp. NBC_00199]
MNERHQQRERDPDQQPGVPSHPLAHTTIGAFAGPLRARNSCRVRGR